MPIYDFRCPNCGHEEYDVHLPKFPEKSSGQRPMCQHGDPDHPAPAEMEILIGQSSFELRGKDWPDKDSKELKERFRRRNKRIEAMQSWQQEAFKKIIDQTGGKRYIP